MNQLGNGLYAARHHEDAVSVIETEVSMQRRLGASEENVLAMQNNLAVLYQGLGRLEEAMSMQRDVYSGRLKLNGDEHLTTIRAANNYAWGLLKLQRFEEAKSVLRKTIPVARRVLGESNDLTLMMRWAYARALHENPGATLDDLREAVTTLEDTARTARRVFGGAHPDAVGIEKCLQASREALVAREAPSPGSA